MPSTYEPTYSALTNYTTSRAVTYQNGSVAQEVSSASGGVGVKYVTGNVSRDWTRTPGFRGMKKRGERLPEQPFERRASRCDGAAAFKGGGSSTSGDLTSWTTSYWTQVLSARHVYSNPTAFDFSLQGADRDVLTSKLLDKIKAAEWSAPVFVAEGKQTVRMVLDTAHTMASVMRDLRKGNIGDATARLGLTYTKRRRRAFETLHAKDPSRAAADAWLQLQYGWKPLLQDVKSAAEALAELVHREDARVLSVRSTHTEFRTVQRDISFSGTIVGSGSLRLDEGHIVSRRFSVKYIPTGLDTLGSLGLLNPASVVWELVPLSFVADWLLPFGRYLQHLDTPLRYTFVSGLEGQKAVVTGTTSAGSASAGELIGRDSYTLVHTKASPLGGMPALGLDSVRFDPKIGAARVVSAVALLRQAASRLTRG